MWILSFFSLWLILDPAQTFAASMIMPADIAVVLPAKGALHIPAKEPFFSSYWFQEVDHAFRKTTVEDAFLGESSISDWRLVSIRFAPCQPLLPYVSAKNSTLCEMELRLVWQPIEQKAFDSPAGYYADDRAIHALFDVDAIPFLGATLGAKYIDLKGRIASLTDEEVLTYRRLHRLFASKIMGEILQLRGFGTNESYRSIAERPEFRFRRKGQEFAARLKSFLEKRAPLGRLKELTAFSLPAGRQPPLLDDWVFLAFAPRNAGFNLEPKDITLNSRKDGRVLFNYGPAMSGTMRFDDQRLHDSLAHLPADDVREIEQAVILKPRPSQGKKDAIADRLTTHVGHTSCASCHKLKHPPFDFHNFSYSEDRPLDPSPRVEQDVAHDLDWLRSL